VTDENRKRRRAANSWGKAAKWIAAIYLLTKGYRILALRYKTKLGEIDLVARKGDLAVMAEVKARGSVQQAVDAVSAQSMRRIRNASDLWLAKQPDAARLSIRYDIVVVRSWKLPVHFKDAF